MADLDEIADLIAKARAYCAGVPEGDQRRQFLGVVADTCHGLEGIMDMLAVLPEDRADEWLLRLSVIAQRLGRLLATMEAIEEADRANQAALGRLAALSAAVKLSDQIEAAAAKVSERARANARQSRGKRGRTDLKALALEQYGAQQEGPQAFAKSFAAGHPGLKWQTVKKWIDREGGT